MNIKSSILVKFDPRIRSALKALYDEWRILRNHNNGVRYVKRHLTKTSSLRVQFGCGPNPKQGWLNVDMWPGPWATPDICLDVSRDLPFEDGSVDEIYSEHMFEHLDYPIAASHFLAECFRVLRPGGLMIVGVPDVDAIYDRYMDSTKSTPAPVGDLNDHSVLGHPLELLNYCFHQHGEHKFLYNEDFLDKLIRHFGFTTPKRRPFDPEIDSEFRRYGTLYMVATKQ